MNRIYNDIYLLIDWCLHPTAGHRVFHPVGEAYIMYVQVVNSLYCLALYLFVGLSYKYSILKTILMIKVYFVYTDIDYGIFNSYTYA